MPHSPDDLLSRLDALGFETATVEHPPLFTVAQSRDLRGKIEGGHTKNLFLKDKKDRLWLVVAPEDAEIDMKRLHARLGSARLSFGKPELLVETLGVVPGSVTPFGAINDTQGRVTGCGVQVSPTQARPPVTFSLLVTGGATWAR